MITLYSLYLSGNIGEQLADMFRQIGQGNLQPLLVLAADAILIAAAVLLLCRHESRRKFLVAIKRKPRNIPLCVLLLGFVLYSFNLTAISNTTTFASGPNMGLTGFVTMLCSVLLLVCCMNAFPYRKKTNVKMLALMFAMIGVVLFCDIHYLSLIRDWVKAEDYATHPYIGTAQRVIYSHIAVMGLGAALAATLPVYRQWLKKINTSVEVEDNGRMEAIDISREDG